MYIINNEKISIMKRNFNIYCEGGAILAIDHVMQKPMGLVAVGEVKKGLVSKGEAAGIKAENKEAIFGEVIRIEIDYKGVSSAKEGRLIGVCLDNISKEDLIDYFRW